MVHITYRHGAYSTEEKRVILKECHFYISDDMCHGLDFVQHNFQLFYNHMEDNNIHMEQLGFGLMVVQGNSKIPVSSNGCVFSTRGTRCHIFGTNLRLDMEKGNMMEQENASILHYVGKR